MNNLKHKRKLIFFWLVDLLLSKDRTDCQYKDGIVNIFSQLKPVNYFQKEKTSYILNRVLNAALYIGNILSNAYSTQKYGVLFLNTLLYMN